MEQAISPTHLEGGIRLENETPILVYGDPIINPEGVHGDMMMDMTSDPEIIRDAIVQKFTKESGTPGFGFSRDKLYFQTFDNGDGTMSVVFDVR